jgi:CheY-like chemotaxis protein
MKIILVEDDYTQAQFLTRELKAEFPESAVTLIGTEKAFRASLEEIANSPPDVFVIDIMLKWTDVGRDREASPPDVRAGKFHRAGFRCVKLLERGERTKKIPVVLYSMVELTEFTTEARELPDHVHLLRKDASIIPLCVLLRKVTRQDLKSQEVHGVSGRCDAKKSTS